MKHTGYPIAWCPVCSRLTGKNRNTFKMIFVCMDCRKGKREKPPEPFDNTEKKMTTGTLKVTHPTASNSRPKKGGTRSPATPDPFQ